MAGNPCSSPITSLMLFTTYLTIDDEVLYYVSLAAKFAVLPVNPCFELENCGFWAEFDDFQDFLKKCPVICPVRLLVTKTRAQKKACRGWQA
jgi:hypothetical protein